MKNYKFSAKDYELSRCKYHEQWAALDDCLYRLCREHPTHEDMGYVNAKVYIIGRTYQTGIERKVRSHGIQGSSMSQVAELIHARHQEVDQLLSELLLITAPLDARKAAEIIAIHGRSLLLLSGLTIDGQSPRSFVAKYMHFHNPVVPISDSITSAVIPSLVPKVSLAGDGVLVPEVADLDYATYVRRFLKLHQSVEHQRLQVSVRYLDYYLVWEHDNRILSGGKARTAAVSVSAGEPGSQGWEANAQ